MNIRRVVITSLTGIISLASISLSLSLAWFAAGVVLHVDTLDVSIRGERNLVVSTSDELDSFKNTLTNEDLKETGVFVPVSTMFSERWENKEEPYPEFYEYYNSFFFPSSGIPYGPDKCTSGFYQETLYLMCDDDVYVSLDVNETYFRSNPDMNELSAAEYVKENPGSNKNEVIEGMNELINSLRFSLYDVSENKYYIVDPYKDGTTYYGGVLDNDNDDFYDLYEDEDGVTKEVIYGEVNNRELAVYEDVGENDIDADPNAKASSFTAKHKKNTKKFLKEESLSSGLSFASEPSYVLEDFNTYDIYENKMVLELAHTVPKQIVLSIYIEGWDLDCVNRNMGGSFISQIQFQILREK